MAGQRHDGRSSRSWPGLGATSLCTWHKQVRWSFPVAHSQVPRSGMPSMTIACTGRVGPTRRSSQQPPPRARGQTVDWLIEWCPLRKAAFVLRQCSCLARQTYAMRSAPAAALLWRGKGCGVGLRRRLPWCGKPPRSGCRFRSAVGAEHLGQPVVWFDLAHVFAFFRTRIGLGPDRMPGGASRGRSVSCSPFRKSLKAHARQCP